MTITFGRLSHPKQVRASTFGLAGLVAAETGPAGESNPRYFSIKADRAEAESEIFARVINSGFWTSPEVMTDEAYDALQAELARDLAG